MRNEIEQYKKEIGKRISVEFYKLMIEKHGLQDFSEQFEIRFDFEPLELSIIGENDEES